MNRRYLWILGLVAVGLIALGIFLPSEDESESTAVLYPDPVTGAVLIDLSDDLSSAGESVILSRLVDAIAPFTWPSTARGLGEELSDAANLYRIRPPESEIRDVIAALGTDPRVEAVERERTWSIQPTATPVSVDVPVERLQPRDGEEFLPNDPYYPHQWHLSQIQMPRAWLTQRGTGVVVAVIDTGVAHRTENGFRRAPDLADTGFVSGWDFVDNDAHPDDPHGHGTHVAGTIAQSTNNGVGVAGVAPEAQIMALRVLDRNGAGGWGGVSAAIRYAADHGAQVINMSLGGGMPSRTVQRAIDHAHAQGVLVVAAAGNAGRNRVEYPSRHRHVVSVGAVRFDRELSFYSNYGRGLDIVAPGGDLRVDQNEDGLPDGVIQNTIVNRDPGRFDYLAWQGTSMASPHVAGVAALIYAQGIDNPDQVESILTTTAHDLGNRERYGAGLVAASDALRSVSERHFAEPSELIDRTSHEGLSMGRRWTGLGVFWALICAFVGFTRRRRDGRLPWTSVLWGAWLSGTLSLLPWSAIGLDAMFFAPISLFASLIGEWGVLFCISALPMIGGLATLHHVRSIRSLLVGSGLGLAAFMFGEALWPSCAMPAWVASWSATWWILNGLVVAALCGITILPDRR